MVLPTFFLVFLSFLQPLCHCVVRKGLSALEALPATDGVQRFDCIPSSSPSNVLVHHQYLREPVRYSHVMTCKMPVPQDVARTNDSLHLLPSHRVKRNWVSCLERTTSSQANPSLTVSPPISPSFLLQMLLFAHNIQRKSDPKRQWYAMLRQIYSIEWASVLAEAALASVRHHKSICRFVGLGPDLALLRHALRAGTHHHHHGD